MGLYSVPYLAADPPTLSPRTANVTVYADLLSVKVPSEAPEDTDRAGGFYRKRGVIKSFSKRSRTRFLRRMATFRNLDEGLFVTLTYPGDFDYAKRAYKRDLQTFRKRMTRLFPDIRGIWRMEYVTRKSGALLGACVPHFHLLLYGDVACSTECIEAFRAWVSVNWNEIVAPGNDDHLAAGTQVDKITSRAHSMRYAAKYAAKVNEAIAPEFVVGRLWGYWGDWDMSEFLKISLLLPQYAFLKLYVANSVRARKYASAFAYGMRLMRAPPDKGINVMGLGDLSGQVAQQGMDSDIMRLVLRL